MSTHSALQPPVATRLTDEARQRVIELRRTRSLRQVAKVTGLPVGSVKAVCSRSGAFRDNPVHRALFSMPPIQPSAQTLPAVPELPPQRTVTGDREVDAVLWLREVIATGQAALIQKAMEAAKRLKTPLAELEKRYTDYLIRSNPGNMFAAISSFGFADLERLAAIAVKRHLLQIEGRARFGDDLHAPTDAELFCVQALVGVTTGNLGLDDNETAARFRLHPELLPHTISDVLHELHFWSALYGLRTAACRDHDELPEVGARGNFVFGLLATIRPRSRDEAKAVLRYLIENGRKGDSRADAILDNLIG